MQASPAVKGSHIEFYAHMDLLAALSTCPGGDLSSWGWEPVKDEMAATCRPIEVSVWKIGEELLKGTVFENEPVARSPTYRGCHGLRFPEQG